MTSENTPTTGPRRIFYDLEFLEDGLGIDLISIGMVDDTGRELYLINRDAPWRPIAQHQWLMANVVPSLPRAEITPTNPCGINFEHLLVVDRHVIAEEVRDFITGTGADPADVARPAQLWAWYGAFDHVALSWLWGPMIEHPKGVPMFTCDLRQWQAQLGDPFLPEQRDGVHNALDDARYNATRWALLDGIAAGRIVITREASATIRGQAVEPGTSWGDQPMPYTVHLPSDPDGPPVEVLVTDGDGEHRVTVVQPGQQFEVPFGPDERASYTDTQRGMITKPAGRPRSAISPGDPDWVEGFGPVPGSGL